MGNRRGGLFVLMLCVLLPFEVGAQYFGRNKVQYENFDFRILRTDHFKIHFYPEEKAATQDAARMAERWYERHVRTFRHEFESSKPVIFYANDADFQQTNVVQGQISQGTGGVTEPLKERVVMPFTGSYQETDHVLGHELVHSFQFDIAINRSDTTRFSLGEIPLWLIEGMAEYLSVGRVDAHTAMWMRDAALRDELPTIRDLSTGQYFPYRYGQAYLAYVGGRYGDQTVPDLFKLSGEVGLDSAFVNLTGLTPDSLSNAWIQATKETYLPLMEGRTPPDSAGRLVLSDKTDAGEMNLAPAISPDGKHVAFLSERDIFNINIFVAETQTGRVVSKVGEIAANPHLDEIRFISSAGSWSPDSKKLAFITFAEGDNEIAIWNQVSGDIERTIKPEGVSAVMNVAWSPDGKTIAFSGIEGGISDLYLLDLESGQVEKLTDDRYADMQPTWGPKGQRLAFVTDRGPNNTTFENLAYTPMRLGLLELGSRSVKLIRPFAGALHHNPQFSSDGESLFFISNQDGFSDIYRRHLTTGENFRITRLKTGVSGITNLSPALSVSRTGREMMFSVFSNSKYAVYALAGAEMQGQPAVSATAPAVAGVLPPVDPSGKSLVDEYLNEPLTGLPQEDAFEVTDFKPTLGLTAVAPPTVGVSVGGVVGSQVQGGVGFYFSDMLGNHNLTFLLQASGSYRDIGGQLSYFNLGSRLNYGLSAGHVPQVFAQAFVDIGTDPQTGAPVEQITRLIQRIYIDQANFNFSYPFSQTRRFDLGLGAVRYGFNFMQEEYFVSPTGQVIRDRERLEGLEPDPLYFGFGEAAYVADYSFLGFTSPLKGARYRLQLSPRVGSNDFLTVLADYRRYFFLNPVSFALRGLHIGNYFVSGEPEYATEYLGSGYYPGFIRGYGFRTFETADCNEGSEGGCPAVDRLVGTRIAMASMELRIPLFGSNRLGLINFPYLPTELAFFADGGMAWTANDFPDLTFDASSQKRVPVFSTGLSGRFNVLGSLILEVFYAYPFQRPETGGHLGLLLLPGW